MTVLEQLKRLPSPIRKGLKKAILRHYERRLAREGMNFLFLVSHMRSGSTLLVHILATSPEIDGYGESHLAYREPRDFARLTLNLCRSFRRLHINGRYVMDKILFDYITDLDLLRRDNLKLILLVRRPEETLPSIIRFRPAFQDWTDEQARDYYLERLEAMTTYARVINDPARAFCLTYEQLVDNTETALRSLQRFLGLARPLSENYDPMWSTGRRLAPERSGHGRGVGDNSEEITRGHIVRRKRERPAVPIREFVLRDAREGFERCLEALSELCTTCEAAPADSTSTAR